MTWVVKLDETIYETEAPNKETALRNIFARIVIDEIGKRPFNDGFPDTIARVKEYEAKTKKRMGQLKRQYAPSGTDISAFVREKNSLKIGVVGGGSDYLDSSSYSDLVKRLHRYHKDFGINSVFIPEQPAGLAHKAAEYARKNNIDIVQLHPNANNPRPVIDNVTRIIDECDYILVPSILQRDYPEELRYLMARLYMKGMDSKLRRL